MKKVFFILIAVTFSFSLSFNELTLKQQRFLYQVFKMSKKTRYKWTLVAIAWKESLAGVALVNVFDGGKDDASCGPFHGLLSSIFNRHPEWVPSRFNKNKICTKLVLDKRFAFKEAVAELDYWYKKFHGNWFKIWAAYNAGWSYRSKQGRAYAIDIARRIRILRKNIGDKWEYRFVKIKTRKR